MLEKSKQVNFLSKIFSEFYCFYLQCLTMFNFVLLLQLYPKSLFPFFTMTRYCCHFFHNGHSQTSCMTLTYTVLSVLSHSEFFTNCSIYSFNFYVSYKDDLSLTTQPGEISCPKIILLFLSTYKNYNYLIFFSLIMVCYCCLFRFYGCISVLCL